MRREADLTALLPRTLNVETVQRESRLFRRRQSHRPMQANWASRRFFQRHDDAIRCVQIGALCGRVVSVERQDFRTGG